MSITTISSREFNHDVTKAKRAASSGPVFITDRGHTAHVLLSIDEYQKITDQQQSVVDLLAMPEAGDIEFDAPTNDKELYRPADFS